MNSNPIHHPSSANKMKCSFLDYVQFLMISRACWWTWTSSTTCLLPKNEMHIFWLCSTSDDWPGWSMDSNTICHTSPAKKMKCSFLYYIQLLMIGWAEWWTQTPSTIPLQPKKWNAQFFDYIQLLTIGWAGRWTQTPSATCLQPKKWNPRFCIMLNFWWSAGLVDGLEPHPPPLSTQKMKCSFLDYVQLLMISWAALWTQTHLPPLSSQKKWNAHFLILFNFWWSAGLVNGLKPHLPALSTQKSEMLIFGLRSTSDDWPGGQWTETPSASPL